MFGNVMPRLSGAVLAGFLVVWLTFPVEPAVGQDIPDCGPEPVDSWVDPDWYVSFGAGELEEIPAERIVVVPEATRDAAIEALASTDIVALTDEALDTLFPDGRPTGKGWAKLKPYLVRGVLANEMGHFYAYVRGDHLWIENFTLGCYHMSKAPVVVFVDREPKTLEVGIGGAF